MKNLTIAAAQIISVKGNVEKNLHSHLRLITQAAQNKTDIILFPELSLTGYEPDLADQLAFSPVDPRLVPLREAAITHNMIIITGAPVRLETGLHIASLILFPDHFISIYTKHFLHPGEENVFTPGFINPIFNVNNETISLAICADIANPEHPEKAAEFGTTLYLAGVLITPRGYDSDVNQLKKYAQSYSMTMIMANHGGETGGYQTAGKSVIISEAGLVLAECPEAGEGLIYAVKENDRWIGY